jgi:hypothetical protein
LFADLAWYLMASFKLHIMQSRHMGVVQEFVQPRDQLPTASVYVEDCVMGPMGDIDPWCTSLKGQRKKGEVSMPGFICHI